MDCLKKKTLEACFLQLFLNTNSHLDCHFDYFRPKVSETTALGAAFVAGLAVGLWKNTDELKHLWRADATWTPSMSHKERAKLVSRFSSLFIFLKCNIDLELLIVTELTCQLSL